MCFISLQMSKKTSKLKKYYSLYKSILYEIPSFIQQHIFIKFIIEKEGNQK